MEKEKIEVPADLGIVIGSDEMAFWKEVQDNSLKDIANIEKLLKFHRAVLAMAMDHYAQAELDFNDLNGGN